MTSEQMRAFREAVKRNNDAVVPWRAWESVCNAFGLDPRDDQATQRLYETLIRVADRWHGRRVEEAGRRG